MLRSRLQLLFFSLSCLLSLCSTQQLVLTFTRSENLIALLCEDSFTGAAVPDPAFFRDGSFIELPSPVPAANGNGSILFTVNREIEGIYECGREASAGPQQRSLSEQRVVTLPFGAVTIPINPTLEFTYNTGTVARLDCPITPGSLRSQYYVIWRSAANQNMIFYRTFPPNDGSADLSFSNRYTVDDQNFSLYISGVTPGDMRFRYQCELGVEDPQHPTTQGITYGLAATLELGDVVEFSMSTLQIGGFILRARLRRPLQDPVALRLIYTDARNTSRSSAPVTGSIQYFAVDAINEVVSVDKIPFGTFMLSVAMVNHRIAGPFNSSSEVLHRRPPPTGVEVSLIVTGSLLGFIILLILCLLVVISVRYRGLSPTAKNVVKGNSKIVQQILGGCFSCNCNCCSRTRADSGERSKNGFNKKSAKSYVSTLKASIKLAESDEVIKKYWSPTALLGSRSTSQEVSEIDDGVRAAVELNGSIPTADDSKV